MHFKNNNNSWWDICASDTPWMIQLHHSVLSASGTPLLPPSQRDTKPAFVLSLQTAGGEHPSAIVTWQSIDERVGMCGVYRAAPIDGQDSAAADIRSSAEQNILLTAGKTGDSVPAVFTQDSHQIQINRETDKSKRLVSVRRFSLHWACQRTARKDVNLQMWRIVSEFGSKRDSLRDKIHMHIFFRRVQIYRLTCLCLSKKKNILD